MWELCYKLQIWHVSTHPYVVSENILFSALTSLILLLSAFFLQKIRVFCRKKYPYPARDFLVLFLVFVREKVPITENIIFAGSVSGIRPPDCSKLPKDPKNDNDVIIFRYGVNVKLFWRCFVSLAKFSY